MFVTKAPETIPWSEIDNLDKFKTREWTKRIQEDLIPSPDKYNQSQREEMIRQINKYYLTSKDRLKKLETRLNEIFVCKEKIIKMIIVCAIAQQPLLLIGPPGTAKSLLITRFCEGLGITRSGEENTGQSVFQYLLHSFTEPDEILGPVRIDSLQDKDNPRFERFRKGSITDAEVIFLDEVFKANSAILNALLTIINERRVYEGGLFHPTKARLIYGASNKPPTQKQLEDLEAFYERFIIRIESTLIEKGFTKEERENLNRLIVKSWQNEVTELRGGYDPDKAKIDQVACLNDILLCNRAIAELWGGANLENDEIKNFLEHYLKLITILDREEKEYCDIDDRKMVRLFVVVRAHALYNLGRPTIEDLIVCQHIWKDVESKARLKTVVEKFIKENP